MRHFRKTIATQFLTELCDGVWAEPCNVARSRLVNIGLLICLNVFATSLNSEVFTSADASKSLSSRFLPSGSYKNGCKPNTRTHTATHSWTLRQQRVFGEKQRGTDNQGTQHPNLMQTFWVHERGDQVQDDGQDTKQTGKWPGAGKQARDPLTHTRRG